MTTVCQAPPEVQRKPGGVIHFVDKELPVSWDLVMETSAPKCGIREKGTLQVREMRSEEELSPRVLHVVPFRAIWHPSKWFFYLLKMPNPIESCFFTNILYSNFIYFSKNIFWLQL